MTTTDESTRFVSTYEFVTRRVENLQSRYLKDPPDPAARAQLAQLRRAAGHAVGSVVEALPLLVNPDSPTPRGDAPTRDEQAIHLALTLYAVHQQSQRLKMHVRGTSFGRALGGMRFVDGAENPGVVRRFQALGTAYDLVEVANHARALVTLLRAGGRGFDYGDFAGDLVRLQDPERRTAVLFSWGRDFYRIRTTSEEQQS